MPQLNIKKSKWEKEFKAGHWDCLNNDPKERARSAVIGMYCQSFYPEGRILDVGCGLGTTVDFLNTEQRQKYLGIDVSLEAIKKARNKKVHFQNIDFIEFKTRNKFDIIIFNEVLYCMDEAEAFELALKFLTKNGKIIVSLYRMNNKSYDRQIWRTSRKYFKSVDAVEIVGVVKRQRVTWRVGVLEKKPS